MASPVRHSLWRRVGTFAAPIASPWTSATCSLPSRLFQNAMMRNRPNRLGRFATATTRTQMWCGPKPEQSWSLSRSTRSSSVATRVRPEHGGCWSMREAYHERTGARRQEEGRVMIMATKTRTKIYPHLWYAKDADEAAKLYASIFPDSKVDSVSTMGSESPSGPAGSVKIVTFTLMGQRFQAMSAGPHHDFNDAISFVVLCDDQAELDRYWNALLANGGKAQACGW